MLAQCTTGFVRVGFYLTSVTYYFVVYAGKVSDGHVAATAKVIITQHRLGIGVIAYLDQLHDACTRDGDET